MGLSMRPYYGGVGGSPLPNNKMNFEKTKLNLYCIALYLHCFALHCTAFQSQQAPLILFGVHARVSLFNCLLQLIPGPLDPSRVDFLNKFICERVLFFALLGISP